jgi:phenylacetate-CoA ligase
MRAVDFTTSSLNGLMRDGPASAGLEFLHRSLWRLRLGLGGSALRNLALLRRWENLSAEDIASRQLERVERLLLHSHDHVPYYRDLLQRYGVVAGRRVRLERFPELPFLDKTTLRQNWPRLRSDDIARRRTRLNQSGGSTGEPVRLIQDSDYQDWNTAAKLFFEGRAGHRLGARVLQLWGSERDIMGIRRSWRSRLGQQIRNEEVLNAFRMSPETMREYLERIDSFRPSLVLAYAESIFRLARFAEQEGIVIDPPGMVFTSATTLYPTMRETIERVFGAPVYDRYGSREVGVVACEQPGSQGLVISAPTHHVEIVRPDGSPASAGETGELIITPLRNFAMPLLRYRVGDLGAWPSAAASGGPAWPRLAQVTGRVTDTFFTPDGTQVFGEYFTHLFYERVWVEMFQVVQEEIDLLHVRIRTGPNAPSGSRLSAEIESLTEQVRLTMGSACRVRVELVDAIEQTPNGKHRFTVSKVSQREVIGN